MRRYFSVASYKVLANKFTVLFSFSKEEKQNSKHPNQQIAHIFSYEVSAHCLVKSKNSCTFATLKNQLN